MNNIDINTPPKKLFLKSLVNFTKDPHERAKLQSVSSPKSLDYNEFIENSARNFIGLLKTFPSCHPSLATLLEHLPPLQPRPYSLSSIKANRIEITFFTYIHKKGLCTSWLEDMIQSKKPTLIPFYFRKPTDFRFFNLEMSVPTILIATGTGIAPFKALLEARFENNVNEGLIWLFYGCRYSKRDFIYKDEVNNCLDCGVLSKIDLAFSRDQSNKCYVQNKIEHHGEDFVELVLNRGAKIFVCGDFKSVVVGVKGAIVNVLKEFGHLEEQDARNYLEAMEKDKRFVLDKWV